MVAITFDRASCRRYSHRSLQEFPQPDRSKSFRTTALLTWCFVSLKRGSDCPRLILAASTHQREPAGLDFVRIKRTDPAALLPARRRRTRSVVDLIGGTGPAAQPCDLATLAPSQTSGLDIFAGLEEAMKLRQPREAMPLTVWMAFAVLAFGSVAYLVGIFIRRLFRFV